MTQAPRIDFCSKYGAEGARHMLTCGWADSLFLLRGRRLSRRHSANGTMEGVAEC